ncbi:MAG: hypothetical protein ACOX5Z_02445 [Desulfobulbus sp.]|jgi:uncharacterized protein YoxC
MSDNNNLHTSLSDELKDGCIPTGLQTDLDEGCAALNPPAIDDKRLADSAKPLASWNADALTARVDKLSLSCHADLAALPDNDALLEPATTALAACRTVPSTGLNALVDQLSGAADNSTTALPDDASAEDVVDNLLELLHFFFTMTFALDSLVRLPLPGPAKELRAGSETLLKSIGWLDDILDNLDRTAKTALDIGEAFTSPPLAGYYQAITIWNDCGALAERIRSLAPDDTEAQKALEKEIDRVLLDTRTFADTLHTAIGTGDQLLNTASIDRLEPIINALNKGLRDLRYDALATSAQSLRDQVMRQLTVRPGSAAEEVRETIQRFADELAGRIGALSIEQAVAPLTAVTDRVGSTIDHLDRALSTVDNSVRSLFSELHLLLDRLNIAGFADTIKQALEPVESALEAVEQAVDDIRDSVNSALATATQTIAKIKNSIHGAFSTAQVMVGEVAATLEELELEKLIENLRTGVQTAADALEKIDLDPYFTNAAQAIDTVGLVLGAVPVSLLSDETQAKLQQAVAPVRAIDFDKDVRQTLTEALKELLNVLEKNLLGEIDAMGRDVLDLLEGHHPRRALEFLEQKSFDPLLAKIRSVNPEEILKPVTEVVDRVKARIEAIDVRNQVVARLDEAFDAVIDRYASLAPGDLLAPVMEEIDAFQGQLRQEIGIDRWSGAIDDLKTRLEQQLERINAQALLQRLDRLHNALVTVLGADADAASVAACLIDRSDRSDASASTPAKRGSLTTVLRWIVGTEDSVATVQARIQDGLGYLRAHRDAIDDNLEPTLAQALSCIRTLDGTVAALPTTHPLSDRISGLQAAANVLVAASGSLRGHRTRIDGTIRVLERLATSGFSQLTATCTALRAALRPLTDCSWQLVDLCRHGFGVDPVGKGLLRILGEIVVVFRPSDMLAPLVVVCAALHAKLQELLAALFQPLKTLVARLQNLPAAFNTRLPVEELERLHARLGADFENLRPSLILEASLTAFESLQSTICDLDPLAPVRESINAFKEATGELLDQESPLRPTVLFADLLAQYDCILEIASLLSVRDLLRPVLDELEAIGAQLDLGLTDTGDAFTRLQGALP